MLSSQCIYCNSLDVSWISVMGSFFIDFRQAHFFIRGVLIVLLDRANAGPRSAIGRAPDS